MSATRDRFENILRRKNTMKVKRHASGHELSVGVGMRMGVVVRMVVLLLRLMKLHPWKGHLIGR